MNTAFKLVWPLHIKISMFYYSPIIELSVQSGKIQYSSVLSKCVQYCSPSLLPLKNDHNLKGIWQCSLTFSLTRPSTAINKLVIVKMHTITKFISSTARCLFHLFRHTATYGRFLKRVSIAIETLVKNHSIPNGTEVVTVND